jgi:hypothetical protein
MATDDYSAAAALLLNQIPQLEKRIEARERRKRQWLGCVFGKRS